MQRNWKTGAQVVAGVAAGIVLLAGLHALGVVDALSSMTFVFSRLDLPRGARSADGPATRRGAPPSVSQEYIITLPGEEDRPDRFLRARVVIVVKTTEDRAALEAHTAEVRDAFIRASVGLPVEAYAGKTGMDRSRALMRRTLERTHPEIAVEGVYFADYLVR